MVGVINNATGKYILYVDSKNSWLDTNMIKFMVEKVEKYSSDAVQVDAYDVHIDYLSYDDRYNEEDGEGLILDNKYLMEELKIQGRVKNFIWGKLYKTSLIKDMLCSKQMKVEESRWLYQALSRVDRYVILHRPMVYCIKED
ncbi:MAG: hypothetical protein RSC84_06215 [Peptostreptococcaceae bacterium]